jgi:hypothetical protein
VTSLVLLPLLFAIGYVLLVLARPVGRCPACRGKRVVRRGRRMVRCRRCKGGGKSYRPGATVIHRFWLALAKEQERELPAAEKEDSHAHLQ